MVLGFMKYFDKKKLEPTNFRAKQLPLFGHKDTRPKLKVKKMISQTRIKEALASKGKTVQEQIIAMRNFNDDLSDFCDRIKSR